MLVELPDRSPLRPGFFQGPCFCPESLSGSWWRLLQFGQRTDAEAQFLVGNELIVFVNRIPYSLIIFNEY